MLARLMELVSTALYIRKTTMKIEYKPIGIARTPFKELKGMPNQPSKSKGANGIVEVYPEFQDGLRDLDGFSHIILLCHFHKISEYNLTVTPSEETVVRGLFATRSPRRPNPDPKLFIIGYILPWLLICFNPLLKNSKVKKNIQVQPGPGNPERFQRRHQRLLCSSCRITSVVCDHSYHRKVMNKALMICHQGNK